MTVAPGEFIRRFMLHILHRGGRRPFSMSSVRETKAFEISKQCGVAIFQIAAPHPAGLWPASRFFLQVCYD